MSNKITVLFDMDGVLADFEHVYHGMPGPSCSSKFEQFVAEKKFLELPVLRNGHSLFKWVMNNSDVYNIGILSSTASSRRFKEFGISVASQKVDWLDTNGFYDDVKDNLYLVADKGFKKYFSTPTTILLDDKVENVLDFNTGGGLGIYFNSGSNIDMVINRIEDYRKFISSKNYHFILDSSNIKLEEM